MIDFQIELQEQIATWGENNELISTYMFTDDTWEYYFFVDVLNDLGLLAIAIFLVTIYSYFVLGGCSPIHFRSLSSIVIVT